MKLKQYIPLIIISIIIVSTLISLQYSNKLVPGFDAYYHIKIAEITKDHGLIKDFDWLEYNIQKEGFADLHFLFHIFLIPFTFIGSLNGIKIASIVFSSISLILFYWLLKKEQIKYAPMWTILLLFSSFFLLLRMNMARPDMLATIFFIIFIYILNRHDKENNKSQNQNNSKDQNKNYTKYWILAISYLFTLSYTLAIILIPFTFLYLVLTKLIEKRLDITPLLYTTLGYISGLIINPYFPHTLKTTYIQVFQIGFLNLGLSGGEWMPLPFIEFLQEASISIILIIISITFISLTNIRLNKKTIFNGMIALFFLYMSFRSKRFLVFLPVFSILFSSSIINKMNIKKNRLISAIAIILLIFASFNGFNSYEKAKSQISGFNIPPALIDAARWLSENTPEDSIVFTDELFYFQVLFFYNTHNHYLYGLDANFGYIYDPELFTEYIGIISRKSNILSIKEKFDADYILTIGNFNKQLEVQSQIQLEKVFEKNNVVVYSIVKG